MIKDFFSDNLKPYISDDNWLVVENQYNYNENLEFETRFALASGEMSLRATHFEGFIRKTLPANYMQRVFDKSTAFQRELVNLPNYNLLKIYYKTEPISPEVGQIREYKRVLDFKNAIVAKTYINKSVDNRETKIESIHFLDRNNPKNAIIKVYITPLNYSGQFEFESIIDGSVTNFIDYPRFRVKHFNIRNFGLSSDLLYMNVETNDFKLPISIVSKIKAYTLDNKEIELKQQNKSYGEYAISFFDIDMKQDQTYIIEKHISMENAFDNKNSFIEAQNNLTNTFNNDFDTLLLSHINRYKKMWYRANIEIKGDERLEKAIKFNIFHLMSTPSLINNYTNIGAKMMHGEEYGGHAFWDTELFILPYFINLFPEIAKNLVEYRYNLLDGARKNAISYNQKGARFPWESADTGDEQCPKWTIEGDGTCYECIIGEQEIHVSSDIIYGGYNYYLRTKDKNYYYKFIEMLIETSIFYISRLEYDKVQDKYILTNIVGPDEWHESVSNNTYTNYLIKWHLNLAYELIDNSDDKIINILKKLNITNDQIEEFKIVSQKIYLPNMDNIIEQFSGYFNLIDKEIYEYDKNNMPILPKELVGIKRELTTINKQADIVMLLFLFDNHFSYETKKLNYNFYKKRTLHRSSLSPSIFSIVGLRIDELDNAYEYLCRSAYVDYDNNQGNTREGMHAASAAGTWQALVYGFAGMKIENDKLIFNPKLPSHWEYLKFSIINNNIQYNIKISKNDIFVEEKEVICIKQ